MVATSLVRHVGAEPGSVFGGRGKAALCDGLPGFAAAARHQPWFVLIDLDDDATCAAALRATWLPEIPEHLCFRIAVRALESWLLADRTGLAQFLGVSEARLPTDPDALPDPKGTLVGLARRARRRDIREGMVPRPGSGRRVGTVYTSQVATYVKECWSIPRATDRSESLARAVRCLERLAAAAGEAMGGPASSSRPG